MADEIKDNDISTASASLVSDVRDTESTSSTVSESLKNICTIHGCLSDRLTSLEKGQSESPVPVSYTHLRAHETKLDLGLSLIHI